VRLFVATQPVDGRKGLDSLIALVRDVLRHDPLLCGAARYVARAPPTSDELRFCRGERQPSATFSSGILEDLEDGVLRPEAVRAISGHAGVRKSLPHHPDVCFCVAVCGRELAVPQPRLNRDKIHSCLQELHRQGVSEKMRRNMQLRERWDVNRGTCNGAAIEMRRTETGKAFSAHADEDGTSLVAA